MATKARFTVMETNRHFIAAAVSKADIGDIVLIEEPMKSRDQEKLYHVLMADIAKTCKFMGKNWSSEDWKRLLVDAFVLEVRNQAKISGEPDPFNEQGRVIPSLDGDRVVQLGVQTRKFKKKTASLFIEYVYSFGAENNVIWSQSSKQYFEQENIGRFEPVA